MLLNRLLCVVQFVVYTRWTPFQTPMGEKKVSLLVRSGVFISEVQMDARDGVLFSEVSSFQSCPYGVVPLYS